MARSSSTGSPDLAPLETELQALRLENRALRRFVDAMQGVLEAAESFHAAPDIPHVLQKVLRHAMHAVDAEDGSLFVLDEGSQELVFAVSEGKIPTERLAWRRLPAGGGVAGWVAAHARAATVNNPREDDRFFPAIDDELEFKTRSILAAPIIGGDGVLGVIELLNKRDGQLFSATEQVLLALMSRFAGELLCTALSERRPDTRSTEAVNE